MKTLLVFTSRNEEVDEFSGVWARSTAALATDREDVVHFAGRGWRVVVFDALSSDVMRLDTAKNLEWNYELIRVTLQQSPPSMITAVLFHGFASEMVEFCKGLSGKIDFLLSYSSAVGDFYEKVMKPFAADGSDITFSCLWKRVCGDKQSLVTTDGQSNALLLGESPRCGLYYVIHPLSHIIRYIKPIHMHDRECIEDMRKLTANACKSYAKIKNRLATVDDTVKNEIAKLLDVLLTAFDDLEASSIDSEMAAIRAKELKGMAENVGFALKCQWDCGGRLDCERRV